MNLLLLLIYFSLHQRNILHLLIREDSSRPSGSTRSTLGVLPSFSLSPSPLDFQPRQSSGSRAVVHALAGISAPLRLRRVPSYTLIEPLRQNIPGDELAFLATSLSHPQPPVTASSTCRQSCTVFSCHQRGELERRASRTVSPERAELECDEACRFDWTEER